MTTNGTSQCVSEAFINLVQLSPPFQYPKSAGDSIPFTARTNGVAFLCAARQPGGLSAFCFGFAAIRFLKSSIRPCATEFHSGCAAVHNGANIGILICVLECFPKMGHDEATLGIYTVALELPESLAAPDPLAE